MQKIEPSAQEQTNPVADDNAEPVTASEEKFKRTDANSRVKSIGNFLSQVFLCWTVQMALCVLLVYEMCYLKDPDQELLLFTYPPTYILVICRFSCGIILHMMLQRELENGLDHMKFAINHYYRFDNAWIAFVAGFLQATSVMTIEFVNFIVILTTETNIEVVMNFMACAVIAEFDNAFYSALGSTEFKKLLEEPSFEDLYKITRTSSRYALRVSAAAASQTAPAATTVADTKNPFDTTEATKQKLLNPIEDDTIPKELTNEITDICVKFGDLTLGRKILKLVYKAFRVVYISIWFYFLPFLALLGSYFVPYAYRWSLGLSTIS